MRCMIKAMLDVGASNLAIRNGSLRKVIDAVFAVSAPEASYFFVEDGRRTMLAVVDIEDASVIPRIAEPLFQELDAEVSILPVMVAADLTAGLAAWAETR